MTPPDGRPRSERLRRTRSRRITGLCAGLLAIPLYTLAHEGHGSAEIGAFDPDAPRQVSPETARHIGLETTEVSLASIEETLSLSGIVKPLPERNRQVASLVSGRVEALRVRVGDRVVPGQALLDLETLDLLELTARRHALQLERTTAEEAVSRTEALLGRSLPEKDLRARRGALATAEAELARTTSEIERAARWLGRSADDIPSSPRIVVPTAWKGVIVEQPALPGGWVEVGSTLVRVVDLGTVQVEGALPESLLPRVVGRSASTVRVRTTASKQVLACSLRYVAPELDPVSRTARILVDCPNPDELLRSEMWVDVTLVLREATEAIVVPRSAVLVDGPEHFVFVEEPAPGSSGGIQYRRQTVEPGSSDDRHVEVLTGVYPGDVVVSRGGYELTQIRPRVSRGDSGTEVPQGETE